MESNYSYFSRRLLSFRELRAQPEADVLVSAFNSSHRVLAVAGATSAKRKIWAVHSEYAYSADELPRGAVITGTAADESAFVRAILDAVQAVSPLNSVRLIVDITGFMRPELVFLVRMLAVSDVGEVRFLYAEPERYQNKGWTRFSHGAVSVVRQVLGCEGLHEPTLDREVLLIGTGYDDGLMSAVAEHKPHAQMALVMGMPPLAPDMYQENVWRVSRSAESIGSTALHPGAQTVFAPANDPFVTADVVSGYVAANGRSANVYISPLGTKVQTLGFALYYAAECVGRDVPVSVLLPFAAQYERETSTGIGRIWSFDVDFSRLAQVAATST